MNFINCIQIFNLSTKQINNLLNTFGSVEDQLKGLSDEQLATAAAGADVMRKLMEKEGGPEVLQKLSKDMSQLQKLAFDQF